MGGIQTRDKNLSAVMRDVNARLRHMILIIGAGGKTGGTLIKALFDCPPAFFLSHACIVTDLTLIDVNDRHVRLPLSKWRGQGVGFFSRLMGLLNFQVKGLFEEAL